jgi:hypothetical protein
MITPSSRVSIAPPTTGWPSLRLDARLSSLPLVPVPGRVMPAWLSSSLL